MIVLNKVVKVILSLRNMQCIVRKELIMKRLIQLKTIDDVKEFVDSAKELDETVLVSKEGFANQFDGASILGMMSLIGERIIVSCGKTSECFSQLLDRKQIV